jgi:hypothetical protein
MTTRQYSFSKTFVGEFFSVSFFLFCFANLPQNFGSMSVTEATSIDAIIAEVNPVSQYFLQKIKCSGTILRNVC